MAAATVRPVGGAARERLVGPGFVWFLVAYFFLNFGQGVVPPLLPAIMRDLGLAFASAGLLGTGFGIARFATSLPGGMLIERRGAATALHVAGGCLLAGTVLSASATSLPVMVAARALVGVGSGASVLVAILYLMRGATPERRIYRGNIYEIAVTGATAAAGYLGGVVAARLGWRAAFAMAAVAVGTGWLVATARVLADAERTVGRAGPVRPSADVGGFRLTAPLAAIYAGVVAMAVGWAGAVTTFLPLYGGGALGLSPEAIGRAMAVAFGVEIALLVPVGWAAARFGRVPVFTAGVLAMLAGVLLVPQARTSAVYVVACTFVVLGVTVWMVPPALLAEHTDFRGRSAGVYRFVSDFAYILAPVAVGWAIDLGGFGVAAAALAAVFGVAVVAVVGVLARPRGKPSVAGSGL
jgi:MFS family permease